jgi:hypothetical protein
MIVRFDNIGGIDDHHFLNFLFKRVGRVNIIKGIFKPSLFQMVQWHFFYHGFLPKIALMTSFNQL